MRQRIVSVLEEHISVSGGLRDAVGAIEEAARLMINALRGGGAVYLFGNGGSAADAQHIAAELQGRFTLNRPALRAFALTTNTSTITAIANDYGYERVFSRQLEGMVRSGDVVVGISTSGASPNVLQGLATARRLGAKTIALVGKNPADALLRTCDVVISVPSGVTARVQECHILVGHILCELVEKALFG
ncbi:MAG: phosphoheptose isomerase [Planctomycetota bacterium]|nr:MAG: phosphoheptose isomerase [Planctomycetota bacterium]